TAPDLREVVVGVADRAPRLGALARADLTRVLARRDQRLADQDRTHGAVAFVERCRTVAVHLTRVFGILRTLASSVFRRRSAAVLAGLVRETDIAVRHELDQVEAERLDLE